MSEKATRMISAIVENKPGVVYRMSNMFRARGFNIDSMTAGPSECPELYRITITMWSDEATAIQLAKQLKKIIDVVDVALVDPATTPSRELALVKFKGLGEASRREARKLTLEAGGRVLSEDGSSMVVELTGPAQELDRLVERAKAIGEVLVSRSGVIALAEGLAKE